MTEKRDRIRISFRVLGVSDGIYWLTWLLAEGAICVITVAIFLLVTCAFYRVGGRVGGWMRVRVACVCGVRGVRLVSDMARTWFAPF